MDDVLNGLAESQGGVFTTAQAQMCGYDRLALIRLVRRREVVSLGRSAYAVHSAVPADANGRHLLTARAALLVYPDAALCGVTALLQAGVLAWGANLRRVDLVRPVRKEVLTQMCRIRPANDKLRMPDRAADAIAQAVVLTAIDHGLMTGVVAADSALALGLTGEAQLASLSRSLRQWPGAGRATAMCALMDGRSESVGESRLRVVLTVGGIEVVPQVEVCAPNGRFVGRVDLMVKGTNVLIEFDGRVKYDTGDPSVLWKEKQREDELRRLGFVVVRVTWADLGRPGMVLARVRAAIQQSAPRNSRNDAETLAG